MTPSLIASADRAGSPSGVDRLTSNPLWCAATAFALLLVAGISPTSALAGGGGQNVVLIVDGDDATARYFANYYRQARGVPAANVFYMNPIFSNYTAFTQNNMQAFLGTLEQRGIADHVDFVLVMPNSFQFRVPASGLVSDSCSAITNFSVGGCYTTALVASEVLGGVLSATAPNRYALTTSDTVRAFDSGVAWLSGVPSGSPAARRYYLGAMLGYTGANGNTPQELTAMIDRSAAADFTRPGGTVYYVKTSDTIRSGPRDPSFPAAIASLIAEGAAAQQFDPPSILPDGQHDCLGVMTGWATPDIAGANMTLLPGSFADHLTSFAATFSTASQTKLSQWIAKGASGSHGAVEEPCNYPQKFPHPRMHVYYRKGLCLGEACFRSLAAVPFQGLIYGDILTQPFAYRPTVDWPAPVEPLAGFVTITPTGSTDRPATAIARFELYVNGVLHGSIAPGNSFTVDTHNLDDGLNAFRVVAIDDSPVETQWRLDRDLTVANTGRSATVSAPVATGGRGTVFQINVSATGGPVREIRLMANERVFAATQSAAATFSIFGEMFGAGPVRLQAVAEFTDGLRALSNIQLLDVAFDATPAAGPQTLPPLAFAYFKDVAVNQAFYAELPGADVDNPVLTYGLSQFPAQATLAGTGSNRLITPNAGASGTDTIGFNVNDGAAGSNFAAITLRYGCPTLAITAEPQSAAGCVNGAVTFTVAAAGGTLSYQWRKDGIDLPGRTAPMLQLGPLTTDDAGLYDCLIGNPCRSVRSAAAELTVADLLIDINTNCMIDPGDAARFVSILLGGAATSTEQAVADLNNDSFVDGDDIALFVQAYVPDCPDLDINGDCLLTAGDVTAFVNVLLGLNMQPSAIQAADRNGDGNADAGDIQMFVSEFK